MLTGIRAAGTSHVAQALAERLPRSVHRATRRAPRLATLTRRSAFAEALRRDTPRLGSWRDTSTRTVADRVAALLPQRPPARVTHAPMTNVGERTPSATLETFR